MTSEELRSLAADIAEARAVVESVTEQALLRGLVAAAEAFDFMAPLPSLRILPAVQVWEPAARHYRDLTEQERSDNGP